MARQWGWAPARISTCQPDHFTDQAWSADVAKKQSTRSKTSSSTSKAAVASKTAKAATTTRKTVKKAASAASKTGSAKAVAAPKAVKIAKTVKNSSTKSASAKLAGATTPTNKPVSKAQAKSAKAAATVKKTTKKSTRSSSASAPSPFKSKGTENRFKISFKSGASNLDREPLTEDQLRKVKSGLSKKDVAAFTTLLLEKRAELNGDVESLRADAKNAGANISYEHMADTGSDNYEQEFTLGLVESERQLLNEIDEALLRIERGYYGVCIETGEPINRARLEAKPWAKYCIEVAREKERHAAPRFRA